MATAKTNKNQGKKLTKKQIILIATAIILVPLLFIGGNIGLRLYSAYNTIFQTIDDDEFIPLNPEDLDIEEVEGDEIPEDEVEFIKYTDDPIYAQRSPKDPNKLNILLIGTDYMEGRSGGLADSIMVVQFDKTTKKAGILSIPRDTFVKIPGRGYDKINHSFAFGGIRLLKETVEGYLDIHVDNYAQVDIESFAKIIDVFGGITVNVRYDMIDSRDGTVYLREGTQKLNGRQASHYVRQRILTRNSGDFERIKRQQEVLMILLDTITQNKNMMKYLEMLEEITPYLRTDVTPRLVMDHWSDFSNLSSNNIQTITLPGEGFIYNRIYYYRVPIVDARETINSLTN